MDEQSDRAGFFSHIFSADFLPHGHCYFWRPEVVWLHVVSDLLIGLSYFSIPIMLLYFVRKRRTIPFQGLFVLFAAFIFWCGTTHFLNILTLWIPVYRLEGLVKAMTAVVSVYTAVRLFPIIPQALALRSPEELEKLVAALKNEAAERETAERALKEAHHSLELRVRERTEDIVRINQELFRSNADLQQFAYIASHDLQEPLRTITVYLQLLEEESHAKLDAGALENLRFAVEGAARMSSLIEALLTYSRVGSQEPSLKRVDLRAAVTNAVRNLAALVESSDASITHSELPEVVADETQMTQLFQNLIGNGVKFHGTKKPQVHVEVERTAREYVFSVRDNGIGIDSRYIEKIFVAFKRLHAKDEYPGMGIGLAVCKKIVERHGGRIWVESQVGRGSTFFFTLPDSQPSA